MKQTLAIAALIALSCVGPAQAQAPAAASASAGSVRVKDLGKLQGWRDNALVGYGIVTGLAGTGDTPTSKATRQALSNVLSQFNLTLPPDQVQSRNVAVVTVSAALPAHAREGDSLDVVVNSAGDARSLVGGTLLLTPLKAPNGRVYALAQGALAVGGYRHDANGNVVQKNHPTVGSIPGGAVVEVGMQPAPLAPGQGLTFVLAEADYTTAGRVAAAINAQLGAGTARARDAAGIDIAVPERERDQLVAFVSRIEAVWVQPDRRAKVVINERTGTVVAGGDVAISRVAISHGELKISINSETAVSQPGYLVHPSEAIRTAVVTQSRVDVEEQGAGAYLSSGTTVADLVQSLARLKTHTRDIISILRAVKAAGALHAELVVQ